MPKKLIIGISVALVLVGAVTLTFLIVRARILSGTYVTPGPIGGLDGTPDGTPTGPGTSRPDLPVQAGPCGDGMCSEGESWCAPDCGSAEERFLGSIKAEEVTPTSLVLAWKTDGPSTGEVAYGTSTLYENGTAKSETSAEAHRVALRGLAPGSNVFVRLTVIQSDGTRREVGPLGFELPGAAR